MNSIRKRKLVQYWLAQSVQFGTIISQHHYLFTTNNLNNIGWIIFLVSTFKPFESLPFFSVFVVRKLRVNNPEYHHILSYRAAAYRLPAVPFC